MIISSGYLFQSRCAKPNLRLHPMRDWRYTYSKDGIRQTLRSLMQGSLLLLILSFVFTLGGCAHSGGTKTVDSNDDWINSVVNYREALASGEISPASEGVAYKNDYSVESMMAISDEMRDEVVTRFSLMQRTAAVKGIAKWLMDEHGHNMVYDVKANLLPIEAYKQKRGNCLSFTMLLRALASELGIEVEFNAVDIPNTWGQDEELGMVFYRHVNGIVERNSYRQIFDLAMDIYDTGYPQRFISPDQALGLLQNNRAIELLRDDDYSQALHIIKLAISTSPESADLWVNMGVVLKRQKQLDLAEKAFLHSFELDNSHATASTNLERLYRETGEPTKALAFKKRAERARRSNPYYHYQIALEEYQEEQYRDALKATNRAILLHNKDPKFYELKSLISQHQNKYSAAYKSLEKAYALASSAEQKIKYANKAAQVNQKAFERFKERGGVLRNSSTRVRRPEAQIQLEY